MSAPDQIRDFASDLRPDAWDEVCGQQLVVKALKGFCLSGRPPKALCFIAPYGYGKTTLVRLTAMAMACTGRKSDDPNPCGRCDSCKGFVGSVASMETTVIRPQVTASDFRRAVTAARFFNSSSIFSDGGRPAPVYVDDLDEHPLVNQQHLKRELDGHWCGFVLAATTKPDIVEPGLLDRFQLYYLQPPEMSDLVPWIKTMARRVRMGKPGDEVARTVARCGGMYYRGILKLLQAVHSFGMALTVESVEKAAQTVGMARSDLQHVL